MKPGVALTNRNELNSGRILNLYNVENYIGQTIPAEPYLVNVCSQCEDKKVEVHTYLITLHDEYTDHLISDIR